MSGFQGNRNVRFQIRVFKKFHKNKVFNLLSDKLFKPETIPDISFTGESLNNFSKIESVIINLNNQIILFWNPPLIFQFRVDK